MNTARQNGKVRSFASASRRHIGITGRIALLSWSVTLLTLLIFLIVIIPEQKRTFERNLDSKAQSIVVSLQDMAAGAMVNEDYSTVVDHCMQLLKGDPGLTHIVITRKDGFSLVSDRARWRTETLDHGWRPAERRMRGGIEAVPLFGGRVFHYAQPFGYSGIEWGWVHISLSLADYDRSVTTVYAHTSLLAVVCVAISLIVSAAYARRIVRPIQMLQATVGQVAKGDLSARASIHTGDEIESLATSFNTMTETLLRRDRILEGVRFAARELLGTEDWKQAIQEVLAKLGNAADASRAYIFRNHQDGDGPLLCSHHYEWVAPGGLPQIDDPDTHNIPWEGSGLDSWLEVLREGRMVTAHTRMLATDLQQRLGPTIRSLILIPILVRGNWWGFLGFDQCDREREWSDAEQDSFRAASDMLGAAIERKRTQDALIEAKNTLEQRVEERTRELREEITAKEQAMTKLAETQQMLMDVSRKSGMAEIATGVLHNVGNVLNSVNVSANLLTDNIKESRVEKVAQLAALLRSHENDLPEFFKAEGRSKHMVNYVDSLAQHLGREQVTLRNELTDLSRNVDHIKQIISMQQSYARVAGVIENLDLAEVIEDALRLTTSGFHREGISVTREIARVPTLATDRHKVLQILINLLRNARQAVEVSKNEVRSVVLRIRIAAPGRVQIQVCDNGVGIAAENLTRVFSHGFTTKRDGHGFGLHTSALAAKELGGSLAVMSEGPGNGATFTLEMPCPGA